MPTSYESSAVKVLRNNWEGERGATWEQNVQWNLAKTI